MEPTAPDAVVGAARRNERPEPRSVAEDAQVGKLVDHYGIERFGWRQDETPRERQSPGPGSAPPAGPRVAEGHGLRRHRERGGVLVDRCADLASRLVLEPRLEDGAVRSSIRADPVHDEFVVECDDVGSTHSGHGRHDADPVETATERDTAAVARTAA